MGFSVWEKFTFSSGGFKNFLRHRDKNVGAKYGCNKHNRSDYRIGFQIGRVTMQTLHRIYLGLLKPPESNSLVSDSQRYYRKNFIACAIFFCTAPSVSLTLNIHPFFFADARVCPPSPTKQGSFPKNAQCYGAALNF